MKILGLILMMMVSLSTANAGLVVWGEGWMLTVPEPEGWVASSDAGRNDGLPVVLFQKGSSWQASPVVMYARIVTDKQHLSSFIADDLQSFRKSCPGIQITDAGINEKQFICETGNAPNAELVRYAQVSHGVLMWVMSARTENELHRYASDFHKVISSSTYEPINTSHAKGVKSR